MSIAAGDHLAEHGHVAVLEVLGIDLPRQRGQLGHRLSPFERSLVRLQTPLTDQVQRGQQQLVNAAEVVEDERLVEVARLGDLPRAAAGEPLRLQGLQGGFGQTCLGVAILCHPEHFSSRSKRPLRISAAAKPFREQRVKQERPAAVIALDVALVADQARERILEG
jgi:hypothetical protein